MIGKIKVIKPACETPDEKLIREFIESADVYAGSEELADSHVASATEPGVDDRGKPWLQTGDCGPRWYNWSSNCGTYNPITGAPGERRIRYRVADTVSEDMSRYGGWSLADGGNVLGVNLADKHTRKSVYRLDFATGAKDPGTPLTTYSSSATPFIWERLISASPQSDEGQLLEFFVAKQNIVFTKFSADVKGEAVTIKLRINGTYVATLAIATDSGGGNYYATQAIKLEVEEGGRVEIFIEDVDAGSGSTVTNLIVELQGYEKV